MRRILCVALLLAISAMLAGCGGGSSYSSASYSSSKKGYGGYDMPNSSDKSVVDYIKRVDPDLYDSMEQRWNSLK